LDTSPVYRPTVTTSQARTFGDHLRDWRALRGLSQLDLAARADVSQRHVSFLETGRSRPSREMVTHLALVLDVPPREQNLMLVAAGHAPSNTETPLEDLGDVSAVIDTMLEAHMPNMAIVIDRRWNLVRTNAAGALFTSLMFPEPPQWIEPPLNIMRLSLHPEGLRPHMLNWERTAGALLRRLERDAAQHPHDDGLQALLDDVLGYPDVASLRRADPTPKADELLVAATYVLDGEPISFFTTIARIGDAHDLTLAELRIETFWPLDSESISRWRRLVSVE
jgi:transcriptional regulator with XRE-family HTH domain